MSSTNSFGLQANTDQVRVQACLQCQKAKRKCDKLLPKCSLCRRLCKECVYMTPDGSQDGIIPLSRSATIVAYLPSGINGNIKKQAVDLFGNETRGARKCIDKYFRTIHHWFPVLKQEEVLFMLPQRWDDAQPEYIIMLMCIHLLLNPLAEIDGTDHLMSLYTLIKSNISTLESVGVASIDVLLCRVLVNIFELGRGLFVAASATISGSIALTNHLMVQQEANRVDVPSACSLAAAGRATRIWRAVAVIDRFLCLHEYRATTFTKATMRKLPDSTHDQDIACDNGAGSCSSAGIGLGGLHEASCLVERVLTRLHDASPHNLEYTEALQMLSTLESFKDYLIQNKTESVSHDSAVYLCNCAMLCILEVGEHAITGYNNAFTTRARSVFAKVGDESTIACMRFQDDAKMDNFELVSPFGLYMLYKMGTTLLRRVELMDKTDSSEAVGRLKAALQATSRRWPVAEHYLHSFEALS